MTYIRAVHVGRCDRINLVRYDFRRRTAVDIPAPATFNTSNNLVLVICWWTYLHRKTQELSDMSKAVFCKSNTCSERKATNHIPLFFNKSFETKPNVPGWQKIKHNILNSIHQWRLLPFYLTIWAHSLLSWYKVLVRLKCRIIKAWFYTTFICHNVILFPNKI